MFLAHLFVLKVSYCDHLLSSVHRPLFVYIFFSVTSLSIWMKLYRKHPLNDSPDFLKIIGIHAAFWFPWQWNEKNFKILLLPNWFVDFSNNFVEMFLGWPSIRYLQAILNGQKTWLPGGRDILPYMVIVKTYKIFSES